jgi:2-polyprenyl-3-methyl-5-hydroxy-6-metoxy-1,4-benzoquinol methylase
MHRFIEGLSWEGLGATARYCRDCRFVHLDPVPDPGLLADYYAKKFWQDEKVGAYELILAEEGWRRHVYGLYEAILRTNLPADRRRVVDVGSGHGLFAAVLAGAGWEAWAVEPSVEASRHTFEWSRQRVGQLILAHRGIDDFILGHREFDVISMLWLLEHMPDPVTLLRRAWGALRPGGILLLAIPNEPLRGGPPFVHPTHVNYWTLQSITALLRRCAFEAPGLVLGTAPMHRFLPTVDYLKHPGLGGHLHSLIRATESSLSRLDLARRMLWYANHGARDLVLFVRRP